MYLNLENIFLNRTEQLYVEARQLLPQNLSKALIDLEKHFEELEEIGKNRN